MIPVKSENTHLSKNKWNVEPEASSTIARLLSELEGASYLLECIDENDYQIIREMCSKYYKVYFERLKNEKGTEVKPAV